MHLRRTVRLLALPAALLLTTPLVAGCAVECTADYRFGLVVTVTQGAGGARVCDAVVTAIDGAHLETLIRSEGPPAECTYLGAGERAGKYTVQVVAGGKMKTVTDIEVDSDQCHVEGKKVTVVLDP